MIYSDAPIVRKEEDRLNRSGFASQLAEIILGMDAEDGLCVSINGAWGSGKTSVINLVENELKEIGGGNAPIILHFSPWNFVTTEQLFQQFFSLLADKFTEKSTERDVIIAKAILEYANAIDSLDSRIKVVSFLAWALNRSVTKRDRLHASGLQKQREAIIDLLKNREGRIVVIIDDLDRLTDEEIRLVFQLVNSIAKFPNTIYLLSFDKSVVVNALMSQQSSDGEKYLEKIVQVPIALPELKPNQVEEVLFSDLDDLIKRYDYSFELNHWQSVYHYCMTSGMKTIREVVRFMNSLEIKCSLLGNEVDVIDLIGITYIELKEPLFYEWIKDNRAILTHKSTGVIYDFDRKIKEMKDEIHSLVNGEAERLIKELDILFPLWHIQYPMRSDELRRNHRIGCSDFVDRYFCFDIDNNDITNKEIKGFIENDSPEEMDLFIDNIVNNKQESVEYLLNEIRASLGILSDERKAIIARLLIKYVGRLNVEDEGFVFEMPPQTQAEYLLEKILSQIGNNETVYDLIYESIREADIYTIKVLAKLLYSIEFAHGKIPDQKPEGAVENSIIDIDQLVSCENEFVISVNRLRETINLLDIEDGTSLDYILSLYALISAEEYNRYIEDIRESDIDILKFIRTYAIKSRSTNGVLWRYSDKYTKYISLEEVQKAYKNCINDGSILALTDDMFTRIVAFEIWNNTGKKMEDVISKQMIEQRKQEIITKIAEANEK